MSTVSITISDGIITDVYPGKNVTVNGQTKRVVNFSVAVNKRVNENGKWTNGPSKFYRCVAWGQLASNIEKSFKKGDVCVLSGTDTPKEPYEANGVKHDNESEIVVQSIGLSLKFDTAESNREAGKPTSAQQSGDGGSSTKSSGKSKPAKSAPKKKKEEPVEVDSMESDWGDDNGDDPFADDEAPF